MSRIAPLYIVSSETQLKGGQVEEDLQQNFSQEVVLLTSQGTFRDFDVARQWARLLQESLPYSSLHYANKLAEGDVTFLEPPG